MTDDRKNGVSLEQQKAAQREKSMADSKRHMKALQKADRKLCIQTEEGLQISNRNAVMLIANHAQIIGSTLKMLASTDEKAFEAACAAITDPLEEPLLRRKLLEAAPKIYRGRK